MSAIVAQGMNAFLDTVIPVKLARRREIIEVLLSGIGASQKALR